MSFAGLFFLFAFLPLFLILYYLCGLFRDIRWRNAVLMVGSFVFYAWGNPLGLLFLLLAAGANWICGMRLRTRHGEEPPKSPMVWALVIDIGVLVLFKYSGFFVENLNALTGWSLPVPHPALPLGLSFFTFEMISYILDVYWGKYRPERSFGQFLTYVSLFTTVTSGPIVRYGDVREQFEGRHVRLDDFQGGLVRCVYGLAKKVMIADAIAGVVADVLPAGKIAGVSVCGMWFGIVLYALQMYFDFSGYSDMAIGISRMLGFTIKENFDYPFCCRSISEFWQRWHISLGSFFRDYLLYVPLFGRRTKYAGLVLVWLCTGLWHGASWNFVIWGAYFGLFVFLETLIGKKRLKKAPTWLMHLYTKVVIAVGFGIFYFTDLGELGKMFAGLVGANGNPFWSTTLSHAIANNLFLIVIAIALCLPIYPKLRARAEKTMNGTVAFHLSQTVLCVLLLVACTILLTNSTTHAFLYNQF